MKASVEWLASADLQHGTQEPRHGLAPLQHYTAEYREYGSGTPLVLVPGLAGGCDLVAPLALALAEHFHVITYQLRGEADCFALRRGFGLRDLVSDLGEFLDELRLECPAVLGVSFGGAIALDLAARHPGRLRALITQGVGARAEGGLVQQVTARLLAGYPLPHDDPFINQFFNLFFGSKNRPEPLFRFATRTCWQTDQSVMAHRFRLIEQFDVTARLARIRVPALILAGDRDLLVSEDNIRALCQGLPQAQRVDLAGSGHFAFITQPHSIAEEVRQFLEE